MGSWLVVWVGFGLILCEVWGSCLGFCVIVVFASCLWFSVCCGVGII